MVLMSVRSIHFCSTTVSFTVKNQDASKSLPRRCATACAACSEETAPLRSSQMANELQHATRWRPSMVGHCKRGLSQLDHSDSESN